MGLDRRQTQRLSFVIAFLVALTSVPAAKAFELSLVAAPDFSTPSLETNGATATGISSKLGLGGGALLGFSLGPVTELELGLLYVNRHYTQPVSGGEEENSFESYEFPIVYRFIPFRCFTLGAGVYYAQPTGLNDYTLTPTGQSGTSTTSAASSSYKGDFGVLGSVGIKIPLNFAVAVLIDGRYYDGLTNASKISGQTLKFRDVQALVGLNFAF